VIIAFTEQDCFGHAERHGECAKHRGPRAMIALFNRREIALVYVRSIGELRLRHALLLADRAQAGSERVAAAATSVRRMIFASHTLHDTHWWYIGHQYFRGFKRIGLLSTNGRCVVEALK
jgi:hypothetical protein